MNLAERELGINNPIKYLPRLPDDRKDPQPLTVEQVHAFLRAVDPRMRLYCEVRFYTGLRTGADLEGILAAGENLLFVSRLLGHADSAMLFNVYAPFAPNIMGRDGIPIAAHPQPLPPTRTSHQKGTHQASAIPESPRRPAQRTGGGLDRLAHRLTRLQQRRQVGPAVGINGRGHGHHKDVAVAQRLKVAGVAQAVTRRAHQLGGAQFFGAIAAGRRSQGRSRRYEDVLVDSRD